MINVLTGGPNSGKSTLISRLSCLGHLTVPEGARRVLEYHQDDNFSYKQMQEAIFNYQRQLEGGLENYTHKIFMDRSLIDILAYSDIITQDYQFVSDMEKKILDLEPRYDRIWMCRSRGQLDDGLRIEKDLEQIKRIEGALWHYYNKFGYKVEELPRYDNELERELGERIHILTHN